MFEPLLFHLFLLYPTIGIINFSLKTINHIFSFINFSDKHFLVVVILCVETFFHILHFFNKSETGKQTCLSLIPLHSMVLMSVIVSSALGVVKKRIQEVNKQHKQKKGRLENVGMPPSYITVNSSFDEKPLVDEERLSLMYSNVSRKSYKTTALYKSVFKEENLLTFMISGPTIDSISDLLNQDTFQKLSVIKKTNSKMKKRDSQYFTHKLNHTSNANCLEPLAKDYEGTWYLEFAGRLQLLLTTSAMTIILVVYNCDLFVVFINLIDTGTEKQIKLLTLHPENGVNASNKINY